MDLGQWIRNGDVEAIGAALRSDPGLANQTIHWHVGRPNLSDPLHYVADCVAQGWLKNGKEGEIARLLLSAGAQVNGTNGRETPLIGAASLGVETVAKILIEAGADLEATSVFGARALHWAAWMGLSATVELLIQRKVQLEVRCTEFGATPVFWAVHAYGPEGPKQKRDQVGAARLLLEAGASANTSNKHGVTALELARKGCGDELPSLLHAYLEKNR